MSTIVDPLAGESGAGTDVSREEILKQIFGDIGTLIEGDYGAVYLLSKEPLGFPLSYCLLLETL